MRSGAAEADDDENEAGASVVAAQTSLEPTAVRNDSVGPGLKDKR